MVSKCPFRIVARCSALAGSLVALLSLPTVARANIINECLQLQQPAAAVHACSRLIEMSPDNAALYNRRGIAHMRNRQIEEAIADYSASIRIDPATVSAYYNRGRALLDRQAYTNALEDFTIAIGRQPDDALAYNGRA